MMVLQRHYFVKRISCSVGKCQRCKNKFKVLVCVCEREEGERERDVGFYVCVVLGCHYKETNTLFVIL